METEVRKSGMLTASKVLGIIQAVSLGVWLGTLGSAFAMIGLEMFLGLSIYFIVATIILYMQVRQIHTSVESNMELKLLPKEVEISIYLIKKFKNFQEPIDNY